MSKRLEQAGRSIKQLQISTENSNTIDSARDWREVQSALHERLKSEDPDKRFRAQGTKYKLVSKVIS